MRVTVLVRAPLSVPSYAVARAACRYCTGQPGAPVNEHRTVTGRRHLVSPVRLWESGPRSSCRTEVAEAVRPDRGIADVFRADGGRSRSPQRANRRAWPAHPVTVDDR